MAWSQRTRKLGLGLLSLFIVWHVIGIAIVGPYNSSYLHNKLLAVYDGYLSLFHLNHPWPFYAPNPFKGSILNYETINATGETQTYPLSHARGKYSHAYFRYTNFYAYLFQTPKYSKKRGYDTSVARYLCAQHHDEAIRAINFVLLKQKRFTYIDYRNGKRPLDEEFLDKEVYGPYPCNAATEASS